MQFLKSISIKGFKSIRDQQLTLNKINLLVGANGAGKSNLVAQFRMLNFMLSETLQQYVGQSGGASSLLFLGPETTPQMEVSLEFESDTGESGYSMRLAHAAQDTLIFVDEAYSFLGEGRETPQTKSLGAGHKETLLNARADSGDKTVQVLRGFLRQCKVYQFHDTSSTADIRQNRNKDDNRYLKANGGNLVAYLHLLQERHPENYRQIVETIRRVAPGFGGFQIAPLRLTPGSLSLQWKENGSDYLFGPHQLPDGLLRFMALTTLLLQPESDLPKVLVIDEPELGLHPAALLILASMLKQTSTNCQVVIATQSATLLDHFGPDEVVIVDRKKQETVFSRPDKAQLVEWAEEYSTGELWQKNLLGGRP